MLSSACRGTPGRRAHHRRLGTRDMDCTVPSCKRASASAAGILADWIALARMNSDSVTPRDWAVLASASRSCGRRRTATSAVR